MKKRARAKKPARSKAATKAKPMATAKPMASEKSVKVYTPTPIQGIGWAPFRYPLA